VSGPYVLAIETATGDMEVALADAGGALAEVAVRRRRRHVESLHPAIEAVCREAGVSLGDVAVVAVDIGPGLFTGLRVGVTAAKMFSLALDVPLVAVTSLEILAEAGHPFAGPGAVVVPVVDMRRGEVAWGWRGEARLAPPAELAGAIGAEIAGGAGAGGGVLGDTTEVLLVGNGAAVHGEAILAGAGVGAGGAANAGWLRIAGAALPTPPARVLAVMAFERLATGATADPYVLVPMYLREADAAINWESRPGRPAATGAA
jgi:tRNA threonylcarbamoyladenosine biosynthesis protein TsaB